MKIGFIGTGNMGAALATAVAKSGMNAELFFADFCKEKAESLAKELKGEAAENLTLIEKCDMVFLGVKPQVLPALLEEIKGATSSRKGALTLVTMAAGIPVSTIEKGIGGIAKETLTIGVKHKKQSVMRMCDFPAHGICAVIEIDDPHPELTG